MGEDGLATPLPRLEIMLVRTELWRSFSAKIQLLKFACTFTVQLLEPGHLEEIDQSQR